MIKSNNPWVDMRENSERRVNKNENYDLFWIVDLEGRYGFCVKSKTVVFQNPSVNLKGITVKQIVNNECYTSLYLILNKNEDWEIFNTLCDDLVSVANKCSNREHITLEIEKRLKKWQQFLKNNNYNELTLEKQMGLFSELIFLKNNLINEIGTEDAILSWVGPNFDKQDFLIDSGVIEVKSYRTSKGEIVHISSLQQLQGPKMPLFLVSYGLTSSDRGLNIIDLIDSVRTQIDDEAVLDIFESKLFEYGYIQGLSHNYKLYKFIVDNEKFYRVDELFPKIKRSDVAKEIVSVKYSIDLSQCKDFEITAESVFMTGGVAS